MALIGLDDFTQRLNSLTVHDFEHIAAVLRAELDSADGEVAWWRAQIEVTGLLRRHHRTREASLAAHRATVAVVAAARTAGIDDDDHRSAITAVARAAGEAARVRVLQAAGEPAPLAADALLHPWQPVAPTAA